MHRSLLRIRLALAAFAAMSAYTAAPTHASTAYRCTRPDGSMSFQDQPCPGGAKQQRLSLPNDPDVAPVPADDNAPADAGTPTIARPVRPYAQRVSAPSFVLCRRYDGTRYISATGKGGGAAVPFGVLENAQAFGPRTAGPGGQAPSRLAAATAGSYVWVDDECHRAGPREACAYLQHQLDDVLARIRSVTMDGEAALEQQADELRERMRGC